MTEPSVLRILMVHESYASRGGEDEAVAADMGLLIERGNQVHCWSEHNAEIAGWSTARKAQLLWKTTWSGKSYRKLRSLAEQHRPDLVHLHNTLPIISPAAIHAAHDLGLPVVMTLHNYRLMCPVGTFLRDGRICEECHTRSLLRGVMHGCYRGSRVQTAAVAAMLAVHRRLGTWSNCVDAYIAPTEFMRAKMIEGGLPAARLHIRSTSPNVDAEGSVEPEDYIVFLGRLSEEKGITTLLEAIRLLPGVTIKIVGAGPMEAAVRSAARSSGARIEVLGAMPHNDSMRILGRARALVFPSICYESLPMTILEAMASGVPVVASRLGAMAEILRDGSEGLLFAPGNAVELAEKVDRIMSDDGLRQRMSQAARATFESRFSPQRSYEKLIEIYRIAIESARARRAAA